jgi:DNA-binding NarL/FixJ family response regulator
VRVFVVDDHPLLRSGIQAVLRGARGLEPVGESGDAPSALSAIRVLRPECAIVDVVLPGGMDGLELIRLLHAELPEVQVLALSMQDEMLYALRAIAAGARGYLMKEEAPERLLDALYAIRRGEVVVSDAVSQRLVRRAVGCREMAGAGTVQKLSDRELEVLTWMGKGASTRQIAQLLRISPKTVETYRVNLKRKLALETAPELLRYALAWRCSRESDGPTVFAPLLPANVPLVADPALSVNPGLPPVLCGANIEPRQLQQEPFHGQTDDVGFGA